jgi:hypothetical protein
MRPTLVPLADLSANAAAKELTRRGLTTARGGLWSAGAVIAIRKRLEAESARRAIRGQETA